MPRRRVRRAPPATCPAGGLWHNAHPDWEGSWRLASSPSRAETGDLAYSPYGATHAGSGPDAFTGQWVDTPNNLNDFPYRFLQPMMGRWLSPDPSGLAAVNPANPQTWNEYAYVANQPLEATDPLGLNWNYQNNTACAPLPGTQVFQGVPYVCANGGSEGEVQTFTVSATPEAAPAPMWEMACGPACISGALGDAAAALQAAVNSFVDEMSYHPNSPGASGGGGVGGTAPGAAPILTVGPSTATPWYRDSCITSAIGAGALKAGVDAIGLLPEAGGVARIIGHQAGYVGVVADQFGANILGAVGHTGTAVEGLVNVEDTTPQGLLSTGLTIAGFIPGASDVVAVGSIILDTYSTVEAISQCR